MSARLTERAPGKEHRPPPRGGLRRHHDFRLLWLGETTNRVGINITGVAMPLVAVVTLDASTLWVSALAAAPGCPGCSSACPPVPGSTGCDAGRSC